MALIDAGFGIVVTVGLFFALGRVSGPIFELLCKDGTALYGSLLGAFAALLGFAIAVISIVTGLVSTPTFSELRKGDHYDLFWLAFVWTIRYLGACVLASLLAIFANKYDLLRTGMLLVVAALTLASASSLWRSGYTLELVLEAARSKPEKPSRR
jgi:hypothetical protein